MEKIAPYRYEWIERMFPAMRWLKLALPVILGAACLLAGWAGSVGAAGGSDLGFRTSASVDPNKCAGCHQWDSALSHPVDISPSMNVPSFLPLTGGRITCLTCHTEGGLTAHADATQTHSGMLRVEAEMLCSQCHTGSAMTAKSMHPTALGRAHLAAPSRNGDSAGMLDQESRTCLSCHDGMLASDVAHSGSVGVASDNHPVGIAYGNTLRGTGATRYKSDMPVIPATSLDPRLRLFNGQVGCGSCHSPYSGEKQYLAISNDRSRLCLSCHGG